MLLLEHIDELSMVQAVAEIVRLALNVPFAIAGEQFYVYPSISISVFPAQEVDEKQLLLETDRAIYRAKKSRW